MCRIPTNRASSTWPPRASIRSQWPLTTGVMIANAIMNTGGYLKEGAVVMNEAPTHRGIYFFPLHRGPIGGIEHP